MSEQKERQGMDVKTLALLGALTVAGGSGGTALMTNILPGASLTPTQARAINSLPADMANLNARIEAIRVALEQEKRIQELEIDSRMGILRQMMERDGGKVETIAGYLKQVWPRLRALDSNVEVMARELEKAGHPVTLVKAGDF